MARRTDGHMKGQQFLGNKRSKEVHDLDEEKPACQIDKIVEAGNDTPFVMLSTAHRERYDNCGHCMIASTR